MPMREDHTDARSNEPLSGWGVDDSPAIRRRSNRRHGVHGTAEKYSGHHNRRTTASAASVRQQRCRDSPSDLAVPRFDEEAIIREGRGSEVTRRLLQETHKLVLRLDKQVRECEGQKQCQTRASSFIFAPLHSCGSGRKISCLACNNAVHLQRAKRKKPPRKTTRPPATQAQSSAGPATPTPQRTPLAAAPHRHSPVAGPLPSAASEQVSSPAMFAQDAAQEEEEEEEPVNEAIDTTQVHVVRQNGNQSEEMHHHHHHHHYQTHHGADQERHQQYEQEQRYHHHHHHHHHHHQYHHEEQHHHLVETAVQTDKVRIAEGESECDHNVEEEEAHYDENAMYHAYPAAAGAAGGVDFANAPAHYYQPMYPYPYPQPYVFQAYPEPMNYPPPDFPRLLPEKDTGFVQNWVRQQNPAQQEEPRQHPARTDPLDEREY